MKIAKRWKEKERKERRKINRMHSEALAKKWYCIPLRSLYITWCTTKIPAKRIIRTTSQRLPEQAPWILSPEIKRRFWLLQIICSTLLKQDWPFFSIFVYRVGRRQSAHLETQKWEREQESQTPRDQIEASGYWNCCLSFQGTQYCRLSWRDKGTSSLYFLCC